MSLIEELQQESIKSSCDITLLLRKAFLISHKLQLVEFENWVKNELNGYTDKSVLPSYRKGITGKVKYWNPFNGWCPMLFGNSKLEKTLSSRNIYDSIPRLSFLVDGDKNNFLSMSFAPETVNQLWNDSLTGPMDTYLIVDKSIFANIIEQVKNEILNWSLLLEDRGIMGSGVSFNDNEQIIAKNDKQIISYTTNIYGNVSDSQIQQGSDKSIQKYNK
ncbi:MAG: hypothetical protein AB9883_00840 [Acidaminococcaceae bacterium]